MMMNASVALGLSVTTAMSIGSIIKKMNKRQKECLKLSEIMGDSV